MKVRQLSDSKGLSYLHLVMLSLYAIFVRGTGWTD